jgi:hypothetical protein
MVAGLPPWRVGVGYPPATGVTCVGRVPRLPPPPELKGQPEQQEEGEAGDPVDHGGPDLARECPFFRGHLIAWVDSQARRSPHAEDPRSVPS